jgi:hypothetical protein
MLCDDSQIHSPDSEAKSGIKLVALTAASGIDSLIRPTRYALRIKLCESFAALGLVI